jgi:hypothetical protein
MLIQQCGLQRSETLKHKRPEALEGQNAQSGIACHRWVSQELNLKLVGGLLRRDQDEGQALRRGCQHPACALDAVEGFSAAGGTEKKTQVHAHV